MPVVSTRMYPAGDACAALRRHVANRSLEDLEQRPLHAFAGNASRVMEAFSVLRAILVDLVDVNDSHLGSLHIVVSSSGAGAE